MNFPQKRKVNVAAPSLRQHNLSHAHVTTIDFGRMKSIETRYLVPGDKFKVNIRSVTQVLSQLPSPTFGSFDVTFRAFFVPINNIWNPFYDFLRNQQTVIGGNLVDVNTPPYVTVGTICTFFTRIDMSTVVSSDATLSEYDFILGSQKRKFTNIGRILYDFLMSNHCNFPWIESGTQKINILPLVAFWKFYFDWIVPSRFIHDHEDYIQLLIDKLNSGTVEVDLEDFELFLCHEPKCYFKDDIFTTCTENAFSPVDSESESISIENPVSRYADFVDFGLQSKVEHNKDDSTFLHDGAFLRSRTASSSSSGASTRSGFINMWSLQTLGKLQDLLNRQLIAGNKVQDWLLTEFGMRPSTDALHLSRYLGSRENSMAITDILSTADTAAQGGVGLGSYGGKLKERFDFDYQFDAEEHGYFFITYELIPRTSYYQGISPEFDMLSRFDFFQPEFDNQQGYAMPWKYLDFSKGGDLINRPFGFNLQYAPLKFAPDTVSGDFRNRFGLSLKSWFLTRDVSRYPDEYINEDFCLVRSQYQDWNYIFSDTSEEHDHFVCLFYFDIPALRPMKSITEGFEPTYKNSNKDVDVSFSGSVN